MFLIILISTGLKPHSLVYRFVSFCQNSEFVSVDHVESLLNDNQDDTEGRKFNYPIFHIYIIQVSESDMLLDYSLFSHARFKSWAIRVMFKLSS